MLRMTTEYRWHDRQRPYPGGGGPNVIVTYEDDETKRWVDDLHDSWEHWNRRGVWWADAPIPARLHRCTAWSRRERDFVHVTERCACGARRGFTFWGPDAFKRLPWKGKNSRRRWTDADRKHHEQTGYHYAFPATEEAP